MKIRINDMIVFLAFLLLLPNAILASFVREVKEDLIAMSKLVVNNTESITVYYRSQHTVTMTVKYFTNNRSYNVSQINPVYTPRYGPITVDLRQGFNLYEFDQVGFRVDNFTGWVQIEVVSGNKTKHLPVFVEGEKKSEILFVESTDTMKAYLSTNGLPNHYTWNPAAANMSRFMRPRVYPADYQLLHLHNDFANNSTYCNEHLANSDFVLKNKLDALGFKYDVASDEFLEGSSNLNRYRLVMFGIHNEYWTENKIRTIENYARRGGSLLIFGGNTAYKYAEYANGHDFTGPVVKGRHDLFTGTILGTRDDGWGYDTYAPFAVTEKGASNYLMKTLDLKAGDTFGVGTDFQKCEGKIKGASGHELDKLFGSAEGFTVIAKGQNPAGYGADVVFKQYEQGGFILNFGSVSLWHRITKDGNLGDMIYHFEELTRKGYPSSSASSYPAAGLGTFLLAVWCCLLI